MTTNKTLKWLCFYLFVALFFVSTVVPWEAENCPEPHLTEVEIFTVGVFWGLIVPVAMTQAIFFPREPICIKKK